MEKPARYGGRPVRTKPLPTVNDSSGRAIGAGGGLVLTGLSPCLASFSTSKLSGRPLCLPATPVPAG
ncbi:MAG: hypothetical protein DRK00_05155, partial [Thermoprotei archaeon]